MSTPIGPVISNAHAVTHLAHQSRMNNRHLINTYGGLADRDTPDGHPNNDTHPQQTVRTWRVAAFSLLSFTAGAILLMYSAGPKEQLAKLPPLYKHQIEQLKREYYPALLADKHSRESCNKSKSSCNTYYSFVIKLESGEYKDVLMDKDSYFAYQPGETVKLERHITDPAQHQLAKERRELQYKATQSTLFGYFFSVIGIVFGVSLLLRGYSSRQTNTSNSGE